MSAIVVDKSNSQLIPILDAIRIAEKTLLEHAFNEINDRLTEAFLSEKLVARALCINDNGDEKRCLLPMSFWENSPKSSFSGSGLHAFLYGTVSDSSRIASIHGFSKIIGWTVALERLPFEQWLNQVSVSKKQGLISGESGEFNTTDNQCHVNPIKSKAFELFQTELGSSKSNRQQARRWCLGKGYPSTWGDDFIRQLPIENKNPRKRPQKNLLNSHA